MCFSAPRNPILADPGSMLPRTPRTLSRSGPDARDGLSLARHGFRFHGVHHGVKAPDLPLRFPASRFDCPFGLSAPLPDPVRPDSGHFLASGPLQPCRTRSTCCASGFHSPLGFLLPSGSKRQLDLPPVGPPSELARSPLAPRSRFLSLVFQLRITVPGPLRFRRLAVPQTSWNQLHYAPRSCFGQHFCGRNRSISTIFFAFVSNWLQSHVSGLTVDKPDNCYSVL